MSKPSCTEVILKPASAARYDSLEIPGLLKHGRVSLMRELFQCGKPLPIEVLCGENESNQSAALTPERPPPSKIKSRTPSFLSDLKGDSAVQRRLQNAINETDRDDEENPSVKDPAGVILKELNGKPMENQSVSSGNSKPKVPQHLQSSPPPIPARPKTCPPICSLISTSVQAEVQPSTESTESINREMPNTSLGSSELPVQPSSSQDDSMEVKKSTNSMEEDVERLSDNEELVVTAANAEEARTSIEEGANSEGSDEVEEKEEEGEEEEESSAEDTADWDPIDIETDESKIQQFSLPSHLRPVAVNDAGVYLLEDGHFFYQTDGIKPLPDSPKPPDSSQEKDIVAENYTSNTEDSPSSSKKRRSVSFSSQPITVFSTHSVTAYCRKNESIDPLVASAEYELEKRVDDLDLFEVELNKGSSGLGISILGMGMTFVNGIEKLGIFVKAITPGGAADVDGRMQVYDQLVEVDGQNLVGVSQNFAATVLRNTTGTVHFVVGREKPGTENSIVALLEADGPMTSSTSSAGANSDVIEDNADGASQSLNMANNDKGETLRKLLEDASLTAAKANLSDDEELDDMCDEEEEYNDIDVDDGLSTTDEPFLNTPTSTNATETEEEDRTLRQGVDDADGANRNYFNSTNSSSSFDAGLVSSSNTIGDNGSSHHSRHSHPGQVILTALQRMESVERSESAKEDLGLNLLSENERVKLKSNIPRSVFPLVFFLAQDLIASDAQVKRLRSRVRRLGQRLTDQEAAADEAIERLCLRCHNLETRLAEAHSAMAGSTSGLENCNGSGSERSPTQTPTPSESGGRGRLSPVPEQGEDTEDTECDEMATNGIKSEEAHSGDLLAKYSSLVDLYEAALKREESLKTELEALRAGQSKKSPVNADCQTEKILELEYDSLTDERAVSGDDRRASDSCPSIAPTPRPRSANLLPVSSQGGDGAAVDVVYGRRGSLDALKSDADAPPPIPPKPTMLVASVSTTSSSPLSSRLNLAALPDSERALLSDSKENPFSTSVTADNHFYECHMHRIRIGTAGAFARKRPPSRYASAVRFAKNFESSQSLNSASIPVTSALQDRSSLNSESHFSSNCTVGETLPVKPHLIPHPRSPFRVPIGDLREALAGLRSTEEEQINGNPASIQTLTVSKNSAFCPPVSQSMSDTFHDSHSSPPIYRRALQQPSHPSSTEKNVRSPDWTDAGSPEAHKCNSQPHLHHHYPRYSPASNHGSPHTSPTKINASSDNSARRPLPPANEILAPIFNTKQSNLMRGPLQGFGTDDPLPY